MRRHPSNAQTQPFPQFQNCPFVRRGKHFFRRFFYAEPSVSDVFVGLQHNRRIARDFGGKDVFAVFKHAFGTALQLARQHGLRNLPSLAVSSMVSSGSMLPVTDCQKPGGEVRSIRRILPSASCKTTSADTGYFKGFAINRLRQRPSRDQIWYRCAPAFPP